MSQDREEKVVDTPSYKVRLRDLIDSEFSEERVK